MVKYNKENDIQLYNFFDNLKKSIKNNNTVDFYLSSCDIIKYVIEIGAIHSGIKLEKKVWFLKKALNLADYLKNKEVKQYLNVIGVNVYSCNLIKDECDKASKSGNKEFNIDAIKENTEFVIDLVIKIYKDVYGDSAPKIDSFNEALSIVAEKQKVLVEKASVDEEKDVVEKTSSGENTKIIVETKKPKKEEKAKPVDDGYISVDDQLDSTPRLPVCICLDFSGSMKGEKFEKMKNGLDIFCNAILDDPKAKRSAEISVITFNDSYNVYRKFSRLDKPIVLKGTPGTGTRISPAVNCALDMLDRRKEEYRRLGMEYYQPWLVFISDGLPGDNCEEVKNRVLELEANKKLIVLSLPILSTKDKKDKNVKTMEFMDGFSANKSLPLDSEKIKEFFIWLSRSIHISVRKGRADFSTAPSEFRANIK